MREGVLDLADGRQLAYGELQTRDGPVVLYCHGFPGSRRELLLSEAVLGRSGVDARVIALNRPGYGPSTFKMGYGFLDWPADVEEAADQLGVERFAVLGASGGCPYALACAMRLPERVTRIGIVVGVAPPGAGGMSDAPGITQIPRTYAMRRLQYGLVAAFARTRFGPVLAKWVHRDMGAADSEALRPDEAQEWFLQVVREAFADGGRTAAHEAQRYLEAWEIDFDAITSETLLWSGGDDRTIPISAGRWLADRLPNAQLTVWPHHGHFSWAISDQAADVVLALTAPQAA